MKNILVLPISGGSFHIQLFLIVEYIKSCSSKPDLILGNSGGSINSYITLCSDWNVNKLKKVLLSIDSNIYSRSWWFKPLDKIFPSYLLGYFNGSIYNNGLGFYDLFNYVFNPVTIKDVEVWSMKVNFSTMKGKMSCNKGDTFLNFDNYNYSSNNIEEIVYNGGNIEKIANDCISSCSIPMIVPAKKDINNFYIDGGMLYASPLTPLVDPILNSTDNFHITYISSFNMEDKNITCSYGSIFNNAGHTVDNIMLGPSLLDRLNAIKTISQNPIYEEGTCNLDKIKEINLTRYKYTRSLLELYPNGYIKLDINNFTHDDINKANFIFNENGYSFRFWHT